MAQQIMSDPSVRPDFLAVQSWRSNPSEIMNPLQAASAVPAVAWYSRLRLAAKRNLVRRLNRTYRLLPTKKDNSLDKHAILFYICSAAIREVRMADVCVQPISRAAARGRRRGRAARTATRSGP